MTKRMLKMFCVAIIAMGGAVAAIGQPTWYAIMNVGGTADETSARWIEYNSSLAANNHVNNTTFNYENPLTLPQDKTGGSPYPIEQYGWTDEFPCSSSYSRPASHSYRSYYGPASSTYKGLAVLVNFQLTPSDFDVVHSSGDLEQTVFFHEQQCYNGGREYGIAMNPMTGSVDFYASTDTNIGSYVDHDTLLAGGILTWTGTEYWFELWPVQDSGTTCHFETRVLSYPGLTTLHSGTISISNITGYESESSFCTAILNEHGYVTAGTKVSAPTVVFNVSDTTAYNDFQMALGAINIGK